MADKKRVVLLIEAARAYGRGLLQGIATYSHIYGPWVFYTEPTFHADFPSKGRTGRRLVIEGIKKFRPNGIIMREPENIDEILQLGLPTIVSPHTRREIPGVANIVSDDEPMGEMAATYLLDRGFRHFAFCGFDDMHWSWKRYDGFAKRITQAGFETSLFKQPVTLKGRLRENEQPFLVEWLMSLPKPVGLMTCVDERSQSVAEACKVANLHVPDEIAIIGVDNDPLVCGLSSPTLSSIALNSESVGYDAAELLDKLMSGVTVTNNTIICKPTHVVTRLSTDTFAIEDNEVLNAIRFIRDNTKKMLQVADVVEISSLSRRRLEQRFRKILGHSINDEIRVARTDMISKMLVETDIPIINIALQLGYTSPEHISRFFKKQKGIGPKEYRKKYRSH